MFDRATRADVSEAGLLDKEIAAGSTPAARTDAWVAERQTHHVQTVAGHTRPWRFDSSPRHHAIVVEWHTR